MMQSRKKRAVHGVLLRSLRRLYIVKHIVDCLLHVFRTLAWVAGLVVQFIEFVTGKQLRDVGSRRAGSKAGVWYNVWLPVSKDANTRLNPAVDGNQPGTNGTVDVCGE